MAATSRMKLVEQVASQFEGLSLDRVTEKELMGKRTSFLADIVALVVGPGAENQALDQDDPTPDLVKLILGAQRPEASQDSPSMCVPTQSTCVPTQSTCVPSVSSVEPIFDDEEPRSDPPHGLADTTPHYLKNTVLLRKEEIGKGGFSVVYLGHLGNSPRPVAVKVPLSDDADKNLKDCKREMSFLKCMDHRNVVSGIGLIWDNAARKLSMVVELCKSDLAALIKGRKDRKETLSYQECIEILSQTTSGLQAVHKAKIIHGDTKPDNIFITEDGIYQISDFGNSKFIDEEARHFSMCMAFVAPELWKEPLGPSQEGDMYALGGVAFSILKLEGPFEDIKGNHPKIREKLLEEHTLPYQYRSVPDDAERGLIRKVMERLLVAEPSERAGAAEVLELLRYPNQQARATVPQPPHAPPVAHPAPERSQNGYLPTECVQPGVPSSRKGYSP